MSKSERTLYLLGRYVDDTANIEERDELAELLRDPECEEAARVYLQGVLRAEAPSGAFSEVRWERLQAEMGEGDMGGRGAEPGKGPSEEAPVRRIGRSRVRYWRWAAAAAVLLGLAWGVYEFSRPGGAVARRSVAEPAPGGNIAMLTLSDGSRVALDSARDGELARQGNARITKLTNGQLAYHISDEKPGLVLYNTLSTPRGGQYRLVLPDGSGVWLNAASSIRYPTSFTGAERKVEVSGEAYFEIAKDAGRPFRVAVTGAGEGMDVEVLGTHFNVNAYSDEREIRTSLLEGSVRLLSKGAATMLAPGQQGLVARNGQVSVSEDADMEEAVAWKEGLFKFENADIRDVMRQIARWYDVEVEFQGRITAEKFVGEIPRSSKLTDVFKILELSNVHFKVDGKKVLVMP